MDQASVSRRLQIIFTAAALSGAAACSYSHPKGPQDDPNAVGRFQGISYRAVHEGVFAPRCVSCHGHSGGVNLETFAAVKSHLNAIESAVFVGKTMPKGGSLNSDQAALLKAWIQAGAPETGSENGGRPPAEPLLPTFASIKKNIFESKCIVCHAPGGAAASVSLETEKALLESPRDLVVPGNPEESGLYVAITRQDSKRMPPPSSGEAALSTEEVIAIKQWIAVGTSGQPGPGSGSKLSYETVRRQVFEPSCISCHGQSGGVNLESYESVKKNIDAIGRAALIREIMPPNGGGLSSKQRDILATWIIAGGPQNPGDLPSPNPLPVPTGNSGELSYASVRDRIFLPKCVSCHGTAGKINLETYAAIKGSLGPIAVMALVNKAMPPNNPLGKEDSDLLAAWIKAGAPDSPVIAPSPVPSPSVLPTPNPVGSPSAGPSPEPSALPSAPPMEPTYASIRKLLLEPRCLVCHTIGGAAANVPLIPYKDLLSSPRDLVLPGNAEESGLWIALTRQDGRRMPPPSTGPALSADLTNAIRTWIQNGAKE